VTAGDAAEQPAAASTADDPAPTSAVRVRCDDCGPRVVALSSVRLLGRADRWEYAFTCTGCGSRVRRSADAALQAVLRGAGAAELILHAPPSVDTSEEQS
jgi:hypothetical protein